MSNQQTMCDCLASNQLSGPVTGQQDIFLPHYFKRLARMIAAAIEVSLARECLVKTTGFLDRLFQTCLPQAGRNDSGGWRQVSVRNSKRVVGMATHLFSLRRHSSESWNPGRRAGDEGMAGFTGWRAGFLSCCHSRCCGNVLLKPLDSGLRRNDGGEIPAAAE